MDRSSEPDSHALQPRTRGAAAPRRLKPAHGRRLALIAAVGLAIGEAACAGRQGRFETRGGCRAPGFVEAARANALTQRSLAFNVFGRPEIGWAVYAPQAARTIGAACPPDSEAFAAALAAYQARARLPATGRVDEATLRALKDGWQGERPWVRLRAKGLCPAGAAGDALAPLAPEDSVDGRPLKMDGQALQAFRRMRRDALNALGGDGGDPNRLRVFSAYRSPESDAARCQVEGDCTGVVRAACSAHRTGRALDLDVGAAPGARLDSSEDVNRLAQSRTPIYRWLVENAARYGFANYVFEPWHWEWVGPPP